VGAIGTDNQAYDVGTGGTFDTPSLRWLWTSAPYFHDGSAANLRDIFIKPGAHQLLRTVPMDDINALTAYLLTLPK
jgi:cytochrome c peroxidase